ncbi:polysaccharide deacetylase family protein [Allobacillus sp. GCM10007491]|uniref:Polysaccharide deacetylase family protein n=1 Tax=Allobacillus saliphilus TaxID=2912308 RepID=A0A941CW77_9BACI|nr:polysaccharide deacetylase family protein [Allobacillus saliphilus]MBR7553533.1 polysaccharide deacetylase family protein [Allobacillus saliphilus]
MKTKYTVVILLILLFVVGCQTNDETELNNPTSESTQNSSEDPEKTVKEVDEEETENSEVEDSEETKEEDQTKDEASDIEKQKQTPKYKMNDIFGFDPIDDADERVVLMTIDDAPDQHAVEMAEILTEMNVPAIFFVNGHFIESEEEKEALKKIHEMGFAIGNHTYDHKNLKELTEEEQREQIVPLSDEIEKIIGERPIFFRAPHGANTDYAKELVKEEGMLLMNWSFGYDFKADYMDKEALTTIMLETELLGNGSNLLMHDREWTKEALPDIITGLRDKGFGFIDPTEIQTIES